MRIANVRGRLTLLTQAGAVDVATASNGRFGPDPQAAYESFDALRAWAVAQEPSAVVELDPMTLGAPAPAPRQVFAIGLNYRDHAAEGGSALPADPVVFTKFPSFLADPDIDVALPPGTVDWEVELVAVIGRSARDVAVDRAWEHVAGLTVGQDLSERRLQLRGPYPQFSLGKSHPGFSPIGPVLVTPDELADDLSRVGDRRGEAEPLGDLHLPPELTLRGGQVRDHGLPSSTRAGELSWVRLIRPVTTKTPTIRRARPTRIGTTFSVVSTGARLVAISISAGLAGL